MEPTLSTTPGGLPAWGPRLVGLLSRRFERLMAELAETSMSPPYGPPQAGCPPGDPGWSGYYPD